MAKGMKELIAEAQKRAEAAKKIDEAEAETGAPAKPFLEGRRPRAEIYIGKATEALQQARGSFWAAMKITDPIEREAAKAKANRRKAMAIGTIQSWEDWGRGGPSTRCDNCGEDFPQSLVKEHPAKFGLGRSVSVCNECIGKRVEQMEEAGLTKEGTESKFVRDRAAGELVQDVIEKLRQSPIKETPKPSGMSGIEWLKQHDPEYWNNQPAWIKRKHESEVRIAQAKRKESSEQGGTPTLPGGPTTTKIEPKE